MVRSVDSLLPQISTDLGTTVGTASIVVTVYAFTHAAIQLVVGPIGDRTGKYRTITIACALSILTVTLCGLAQSLSGLAIARLAAGATVAWLVPLSLAFIGDVVAYELHQRVLGRFLAGQVAAQLIGQATGGVIGDLFGWRTVFFVLAGLFAVAAVLLIIEFVTNRITRRSGQAPANNPFADYRIVLANPWARFVPLVTCIEGALVFGVFTYIGADLHQRFGLSFTTIGLTIAASASAASSTLRSCIS